MKRKLMALALTTVICSSSVVVTNAKQLEQNNKIELHYTLNKNHWAYNSAMVMAELLIPVNADIVRTGDVLVGVLGLTYLNNNIQEVNAMNDEQLKATLETLKSEGYLVDSCIESKTGTILKDKLAILKSKSIMDVVKQLIDWTEPTMTAEITRKEVADLVYKYFKELGKQESDEKHTYIDVDNLEESINFCVDNKIMLGDAQGKFRPTDVITDVELACTLSRVYLELIK